MGIEHDLVEPILERLEKIEAHLFHDKDVVPGTSTPIPPMEPVASIPDPPTEA